MLLTGCRHNTCETLRDILKCVLAYQYSRTGKFGNNGLHCEPFVIEGCDWTGESQIKAVPIGQKKVISY